MMKFWNADKHEKRDAIILQYLYLPRDSFYGTGDGGGGRGLKYVDDLELGDGGQLIAASLW